jgi:hypothetical protein
VAADREKPLDGRILDVAAGKRPASRSAEKTVEEPRKLEGGTRCAELGARTRERVDAPGDAAKRRRNPGR